MTDRFNPDKNLPANLPTTAARIECRHCGKEFPVGQMKWDHRRGIWVCAEWPDCEGAGFHCDLHASNQFTKQTTEPVRASTWPQPTSPKMPEPKLHGEQLIAIPDVPDYLPARRGKKLHFSTVYRWVLKGARGKVLDSTMLGGIRYTSLEALERFLGTSTAELVEVRRMARVRASLDVRGLANPRFPIREIPGRKSK